MIRLYNVLSTTSFHEPFNLMLVSIVVIVGLQFLIFKFFKMSSAYLFQSKKTPCFAFTVCNPRKYAKFTKSGILNSFSMLSLNFTNSHSLEPLTNIPSTYRQSMAWCCFLSLSHALHVLMCTY